MKLAKEAPSDTTELSWFDELVRALDDLERESLKRLEAVVREFPSGRPDVVYRTLKLLEAKYGTNAAVSPVAAAVGAAETAATHVARSVGTLVGDLASRTYGAVDALLEAGRHDDDALLRKSDCRYTGSLTSGPQAGATTALLNGLPVSHPAREIEPIGEHRESHIVTGFGGRQLVRVSEIKRRTEAHRTWLQEQHAERERLAALESDRQRRIRENDPAHLRERVATLEAELERLRAGTAAG